tara:strand:+ start:1156 stop:1566 length:411 start_codon:yes stop_codon:yes gene_type:complete
MTLADLYSFFAVQQLFDPTKVTSAQTFTSDAVSVRPAFQTLILVNVGAVITAGTLDVKLTECDTADGVYTDVVGGAFTQYTKDRDDRVETARVISTERKKFLKVVSTVADGNASFSITALRLVTDTGNADTTTLTL